MEALYVAGKKPNICLTASPMLWLVSQPTFTIDLVLRPRIKEPKIQELHCLIVRTQPFLMFCSLHDLNLQHSSKPRHFLLKDHAKYDRFVMAKILSATHKTLAIQDYSSFLRIPHTSPHIPLLCRIIHLGIRNVCQIDFAHRQEPNVPEEIVVIAKAIKIKPCEQYVAVSMGVNTTDRWLRLRL